MLNFEEVTVLTNVTKYPPNILDGMDPFSLHNLHFDICLASKIPHIWIIQH